jgi:Periplasmic lysozyme inhibitor of I-type lysozyme
MKMQNGQPRVRFLRIVALLMLGGLTHCAALALGPVAARATELRESIDGVLAGRKGFDYLIRGKAGQTLRISAKSKRPKGLLLRVLPPAGEGPDLFSNAATSELSAEMTLPVNGDYVLNLGVKEPGARKGRKIDYLVVIDVLDPPGKEAAARDSAPKAFSDTKTLHGISFKVTCPNEGSINRLTIRPKGLKGGDAPIEREVDGTVYAADIADLDVDGSPEIYVFTTSAGSGSYGSLIAYSVNKNASLSEIRLPDINENKAHSKGYMGHDKFGVGEGALVRRFPIYREGDTNSAPSGGTRQIQYKLEAGEAGPVLRVDKMFEY